MSAGVLGVAGASDGPEAEGEAEAEAEAEAEFEAEVEVDSAAVPDIDADSDVPAASIALPSMPGQRSPGGHAHFDRRHIGS
ncbi:MAG TPA: hypothetical protein VGX23_08740 [Actinocrinis sp.]|nr:hypothetical protein [Actinocrinis sp.]